MEPIGLLPLVAMSGIALIALLVAGRLRIPPLVALIVTGIIVGPSALAIVPTREQVELLAEIGVVLLMFTVGLEFSFVAVRPMLAVTLVGGSLQLVLTTLAMLSVMTLATPDIRLGLFVGFFVALTSTAILLKELGARNAINAPHGRLVVAVSLVQDTVSILILTLLPVLAGRAGNTSIQWAVLRAVLALASVLAFGSWLLPRLIRLVSANRTRESFSLAVMLVSLGTAWFTSQLGVSMALGAFLAGLVLAENEYSHQIHAEIRPLRDILTSVFFISVGMIIDVHALIPRLPLVLGAAFVVVIVKALASAAAMLLVRVPLRQAAMTGILLVPVGEFSFVMGRAALDLNILSSETWQVLLGTSVVTMVAAPGLVNLAQIVGDWIADHVATAAPPAADAHVALSDHVIILGFGVGGRLIARALRNISAPYLILELNGRTVGEATRQNEPIMFGDAANPDALHAAGIQRARAVVTVLSDIEATLRAVRGIRSVNPTLPIITRARYRTEAARLQRAGATLAVAEELEASLEVLAQLLMWLGIPGNALELLIDTFRRDSTAGRPLRAPSLALMNVPEAIQKSPVATHQIAADDWANGRTLGDVELRAETGATVLAIATGERYMTSPTAAEMLMAGQVLYLLGDESDIILARDLLTTGPRRSTRPPAEVRSDK